MIRDRQPTPWVTITIIVLVIAIAVVGVWFAADLLAFRTKEQPEPTAVSQRTLTASAFPNPTFPPTATATPIPSATSTTAPTSTTTPTPTPSPTPTATQTPTPTPLPPLQWQELGYLTSLEYTTSTIVEKERTRPGLGSVLGTDRILLMAIGRILVGIDLEQVTDSDVEISGTSIELTLPHAIVISVELLPDESTIYETDKSWLFSEYEGLEVEALEQARTQLLDSASGNQSMMELAETMARLQLTEFLRSVGYEQIVIRFDESTD